MDREIIVGNAASVLYQCSFVLIAIILVEFDTGSIEHDNQFQARLFKKTPTFARPLILSLEKCFLPSLTALSFFAISRRVTYVKRARK